MYLCLILFLSAILYKYIFILQIKSLLYLFQGFEVVLFYSRQLERETNMMSLYKIKICVVHIIKLLIIVLEWNIHK